MLPSQGLFRSIPCPFFLAGLCERPHCSYRHCRSDIRIDRKLESETLDDTLLEEEREQALPSKPVTGVSSRPLSNDAADYSSKEPVVQKISDTPVILGEKPVTSKINTTERLKTADPLPVTSRKRSCDTEGHHLSKRRRESEVEVPSEMGSIVSTVAGGVVGVCKSALNQCLPESKSDNPEELPDIDELVRQIESAGKSPRQKHKKAKKHKNSRSRDSESSGVSVSAESPSKDKQNSRSSSPRKEDKQNSSSSSTRKEDKQNSSSSSPRKEDKTKISSKNDELHKKDKEKERKDSRRDSHSKHEHSRKKESSSSPTKHSSKSSSSHRKQSSSSEKRSSSSRKDRKKDSSSSASPSKKERRPSGSSSGKGSSDSGKELIKPAASVDVSNRFTALSQDSADESAYNSDICEDASFNYAFADDSDDDPDMVERECMEMFENYKPEQETKPVEKKPEVLKSKDSSSSGEGFCLVGKKRLAHANATSTPTSTHSSSLPPRRPPATSKNLQEQLCKRFENQAPQRTISQNGSSQKFAAPPPPAKPTGKARIAHVPNAGKLAQKPTLAPSSGKSSSSAPADKPGTLTYSQTAAKGVPRAAHKPSAVVLNKPGPIVARNAINKTSKIPHNTRQTILDKLYSEYVRILGDYSKAFEASIEKEHELLSRCTSKHVYYNSGISAITGLRKAYKDDDGDYSSSVPGLVSHELILTGSLESKNCSVRKSKKDVTLPHGDKLYKALLAYLMTEEQLQENGYPREHPQGELGRVIAKPRTHDSLTTMTMTLTDRICDRCKRRYKTTEEGEHLVAEVCNYHWGRKYNMMTRGGRGMRESTYTCCGSDDDRLGCVTAACHVSKSPVPLDSQKGFVSAVFGKAEEEGMGLGPWDIIGVDCEMVYTTHGNELARVTVVGVNGEVLFDSVIKPTHKVLDCNTRFSGLTFEDLEQATRSITDVQAALLTYLRRNTIIIGHSLESDLIALRIRHDTVIDTAILYPHKMGPPKKRALKTLAVEYLNKVIQDSDSGHDSAEDAQIAVELVLAKLKHDMSTKH